MTEGCQRRTGNAWNHSVCGKTPVEMVDGKQLCKRHAAARRGAATAKAKRYEAYDQRQELEESWIRRMKTVADKLGVEARLSYSLAGRSRIDSVVISLADFERLAGIEPPQGEAKLEK